NARWLGYPVRELLARAGVRDGADMVLSTSADGWTASTPLDVLTDPDRACLLAVGMNGEPLPPAHGFPARLVVPGLYGYVSATKWVTELKVTTFADDVAYWSTRGWSERGPIKLASRVDTPRAGAGVPSGPVTVAGVAWAQHTGIAAVEVRVDDGAWRAATVAETVGPDAWRQWSCAGGATRGVPRLTGRAPGAGGGAPSGPGPVAGVAWAQHTGIAAVEVRVDDGAWRAATLAETVGPDTWRQWSYAWDATPGEHRLTVRATDADGRTQTSDVAPPAPDGASGWHEVTVRVT